MASMAPIILTDGETTPVDHTFTPISKVGNLVQYQNLAESYAAGRESLVTRFDPQVRGLRKVVLTLKAPRVLDETINGVTVSRVADFCQIKVEALVPLTWTEQEIKNVRVMAQDLMGETMTAKAIDTGEYVYG